jgi:hypothetical protein
MILGSPSKLSYHNARIETMVTSSRIQSLILQIEGRVIGIGIYDPSVMYAINECARMCLEHEGNKKKHTFTISDNDARE